MVKKILPSIKLKFLQDMEKKVKNNLINIKDIKKLKKNIRRVVYADLKKMYLKEKIFKKYKFFKAFGNGNT